MELMGMFTLRRPGHQRLREGLQWFTVVILLATAALNMVHLAKAAPHILSLWLLMALFAVAPIIFFVRAVRNPTDHNKQTSCLVSVCTVIFAGMPFAHILC